MKRVLVPIVLIVVAAAALLAYRYVVLDSPREVLDRVASIHEEQVGLDSRITNYVDAMRAIGAPFRSSAGLTELVQRIEEARDTTVFIEGAEISPWTEIASHTPGSELIGGALEAIESLVVDARAVEVAAGSVRTAAVAYMVARERAEGTPSAASVSETTIAAGELATAIDDLRELVVPMAASIAAASDRVDGATEWLASVAPDGSHEGVVVGSMQTALRGLAGAVQVPERHFEEVAARMVEDAAALRRIAGAAERMRGPVGM